MYPDNNPIHHFFILHVISLTNRSEGYHITMYPNINHNHPFFILLVVSLTNRPEEQHYDLFRQACRYQRSTSTGTSTPRPILSSLHSTFYPHPTPLLFLSSPHSPSYPILTPLPFLSYPHTSSYPILSSLLSPSYPHPTPLPILTPLLHISTLSYQPSHIDYLTPNLSNLPPPVYSLLLPLTGVCCYVQLQSEQQHQQYPSQQQKQQ